MDRNSFKVWGQYLFRVFSSKIRELNWMEDIERNRGNRTVLCKCAIKKSRGETKVCCLVENSILLSEAQQTIIQMENVCACLKRVSTKVTPKLRLSTTLCLPSILRILLLKMWWSSTYHDHRNLGFHMSQHYRYCTPVGQLSPVQDVDRCTTDVNCLHLCGYNSSCVTDYVHNNPTSASQIRQ